MAQTLEALFEKEFQEAEKTLEDLRAQREAIEQRMSAAEQRFTNLRNAQAALQGKLIVSAPKERKPRKATGTRAPRGVGGELQTKILAIVEQLHGKATAEDINAELQADTAEAKKPIAAALFRMKKNGGLLQPKARGPYLIPTPTREAFEPPAGE